MEEHVTGTGSHYQSWKLLTTWQVGTLTVQLVRRLKPNGPPKLEGGLACLACLTCLTSNVPSVPSVPSVPHPRLLFLEPPQSPDSPQPSRAPLSPLNDSVEPPPASTPPSTPPPPPPPPHCPRHISRSIQVRSSTQLHSFPCYSGRTRIWEMGCLQNQSSPLLVVAPCVIIVEDGVGRHSSPLAGL